MDYVVLFDSVTGTVDAMWPRTTSDNITTAAVDEYIMIDGEIVAAGYNVGTGLYVPKLALITDPTEVPSINIGGALEVDSVSSPTDVVEREAGDGGKNPYYPYDEPVE